MNDRFASESREPEPSEPLFRCSRSVGVGACFSILAISLPLGGIGFLMAAVAIGHMLQGIRRDGDTMLVAASILLGVLGLIAAVGAVWSWFRGYTWWFAVDGLKLSWHTPRADDYVLLQDVRAIDITESETAYSLWVSLIDDETKKVPSGCLRKLERLSEVLHDHYPWIQVRFDWLPTCEVCGAPSKRVVHDHATAQSDAHQAPSTHYFCRRHKRKPIRDR